MLQSQKGRVGVIALIMPEGLFFCYQAFTQCRGMLRKEVISLRGGKGWLVSGLPSDIVSGIELVDDEGNLNEVPVCK